MGSAFAPVARRLLAAALLLRTVAAPPVARAEAEPAAVATPASEAEPRPGGLGVARFFEEQTLELPPTRPAATLAFPVGYAARLLWDTGYVLTGPGRWDRGDWTRLSLLAALLGGALGADRTIDVESRRRHPRSSGEERFEDGVENAGSAAGIAAVIAGSELYGFLADSDGAKALGADAAEAIVISGLLTASLKDVVGRSRPNRGDGPFRFHPFSGNASFPSGHTTAAFSLAAVVSEHFENSLWVAGPAYGLAAVVGFSRTRANAHFASDVLAAGIIGTSTAKTAVELERRRLGRAAAAPAEVSLLPWIAPEVRGVQLAFEF